MIKDKEIACKIFKCENFKKEGCSTFIDFQDKYKSRQNPEPWNGNIKSAKYLFISSNPSYDAKEKYQNEEADDQTIYEYFNNRFEYYEDIKKVHYWYSINKWTHWLDYILKSKEKNPEIIKEKFLNYKKKNPNNLNKLKGEVCITEVCHCKSKDAIGVKEHSQTCVDLYLEKVLSLFKGKIIIVVGAKANEYFDFISNKSKKSVIKAAHPACRCRGLNDLERINELLKQLENLKLI